jgi:hypothetical protein
MFAGLEESLSMRAFTMYAGLGQIIPKACPGSRFMSEFETSRDM